MWGAKSPLPPAKLPRACAGLGAHGPRTGGARGADAAADRAALGGTARAGWVPRAARGVAGRAGLSATGGCRVAPLRLPLVVCGCAHVSV